MSDFMNMRVMALFLMAASAPMPAVCEPQTRDERFGEAMQLLEKGGIRQALKRLSKLNEESPDTCIECLLAMASAQSRLGRYSAAEKSAQSVIDATENRQALVAAYTFLGFSHYMRPSMNVSFAEFGPHVRQSLEPFRKAYELDGGPSETVRWNLAAALEWVGRRDQVSEVARLYSDPPFDAPRERPLFLRGNVEKPTKIKEVQPQYSERARLSRVQGVVILQTIIDKQGNIANVKVIKPLQGCTTQAILAVRQWKYKPATLDGQPVAVYFNLTVNFVLE